MHTPPHPDRQIAYPCPELANSTPSADNSGPAPTSLHDLERHARFRFPGGGEMCSWQMSLAGWLAEQVHGEFDIYPRLWVHTGRSTEGRHE